MRKGLVVLAMPPAETWEALNLSAFNILIEVTNLPSASRCSLLMTARFGPRVAMRLCWVKARKFAFVANATRPPDIPENKIFKIF